MNNTYDYIVIGSGFGGSVSALRLAEKGYRVALLEEGLRWKSTSFPRTNWNLRRFLWLPSLSFRGIQRITFMRHVGVLSGAGVGGGSLVYAATLYRPLPGFYKTPVIRKMGGEKSLSGHFERAEAMLGTTPYPYTEPADEVFRRTGERLGVGSTFRPTVVGIHFGPDGTDPYFRGEGPARNGCVRCGGCMVGCRYDAKNTLDKNYLHFAEKLGVRIMPESRVVAVVPLSPDGSEGYEIHHRSPLPFRRRRSVLRTKSVVLSAGVLGNLKLLIPMKERGVLPGLSSRLGHSVRTNNESLLRVTSKDKETDYSSGAAITSSLFLDEETHLEPVRYSPGSDIMGLLFSLFTRGRERIPRQLLFLGNILRHPVRFIAPLWPFGFAKRSVIVLGMQSVESTIRIVVGRPLLRLFFRGLTTRKSGESVPPTYIKSVYDFTEELARTMKGTPGSSLTEVLFDMAPTAHILGGCVMGETKEEGVVDSRHRVFGYENFLIVDGSTVPANPGVNPSLTIAAMAERAMDFIPPRSGDGEE